MIGTELLRLLKEMTGTEHSKIHDDKMYRWLSLAHREVANSLNSYIDTTLFYGKYEADLVAGQSRYDNFPVRLYDSVGVKYIQSEEIRTKAIPVDMQERKKMPEYYSENQATGEPMYEIVNETSIIIYPTPTSDVLRGIQVIGKNGVGDINANSVLNDVLMGKIADYHTLIIDRAKVYVYQYKENEGKALGAKEDYRLELMRVLAELSTQGDQPMEIQEPDWDEYL